MTEEEQHRNEVIGKLFTLMTARFEDGAELAVRGQGSGSVERTELASRMLDIGQEIAAVSEGVLLLLAE
jgi:hypothetical protein